MKKCVCFLGPFCLFALSLAGCGQDESDTTRSGGEPSGGVSAAPITPTGGPEPLRPAAGAGSSGGSPGENAGGGTAAGAAGIEAPGGADGGNGRAGSETLPDDADAGDDAGDDGDVPPTVNGATCNIVNDTIVVPEGGFCALTEQQQSIYGLSGFDEVSCNQGRVTSGFTSGGQINLNGLQMRCEASED